jgi:5'-nucleotidase
VRVLLTNDDGVEAAGLEHLRASLIGAGLAVVVVAPRENRSGLARACTPRRPVRIERLGGDDANPIHVCDGTPVDCVRTGVLTELAPDASLVLAGINHGANLGGDCFYSGTVGAGIEAALLGLPSLCVSQQPDDGRFRFRDAGPYSFGAGAAVAARLARAIAERPPPEGSVVNLNVPARLLEPRIEVTRLGRRHESGGRVALADTDEVGSSYYLYGSVEDPDPAHEDAPGTDFAALAGGRISATPLALPWQVPDRGEAVRLWLHPLVGAL